MPDETLETLDVNPPGEAAGTVFWLHGLGADNRDFLPIVPELRLQRPLRFVFPNAPMRPVGINNGMVMRAWYDISPQMETSMEDITASVDALERLVQAEVARGTARGRIVLAGFSQGGVIAQHLALRTGGDQGGLLGLSTYLPMYEQLQAAAPTDLAWMVMHGRQDAMIPLDRARAGLHGPEKAGYRPQWKEYEVGHGVCPEQIRDISAWLDERSASF